MYQQKFNNQNQKTILSQKTKEIIFKYALEMKHLTLAQIEKKFFGGRHAHQEVTDLEKQGYLRKKDRDLKFGSVFIPTAKAYDEVHASDPCHSAVGLRASGAAHPLLPQPMSQIFAPRVNHDSKLTDLRIRFEELNFITKWTSERMLAQIPKIKELLTDEPDAVCSKKDGDGYFLELELSQKTKAQYEYRIQRYLETLENTHIKEQKITGVIFICGDRKVQDFIKALLSKNEKRISVLLYERYFKQRGAMGPAGQKRTEELVQLRPAGTSSPSLREKHNSSVAKWEKTRESVRHLASRPSLRGGAL